jgi:uncharacterized membrane protein YedE/YeeE
MSARMRIVIAFVCGLLFGIGLLISGMVDPDKVRGFLDITGQWDPSLALVMAGAIGVAMPCMQWARRHDAQRNDTAAGKGDADSESHRIDRPLIIGSLVFGIGWGVSGYCPGPALVAASSGHATALWYVLAMAVGGWLAALSRKR